MVAKVTVGHGFLGAYERKPEGKVIWVGANYWMADGKPGAAGFDGGGSVDDTKYQADSRRTLAAMTLWLTGVSSGLNILIAGVQVTYPTPSSLGHFGFQFENALVAAGHTVTWTGVSTGLGSENPANYDLVCIPTDLGSSEMTQAEFDTFLADGVCWIINGAHYASGYNVQSASLHGVHNETAHKIHYGNNGPQTGNDYPGWAGQRPFNCSAFGVPPLGGSWNTTLWALVMGTTNGLYQSGDSSKGGTTTFYQCALEQYGNHIDIDTDGLHVIATWEK
jgi:hypothetical protein